MVLRTVLPSLLAVFLLLAASPLVHAQGGTSLTCEKETISLSCPDGLLIDVTDALYGRTSRTPTCGPKDDQNADLACASEASLSTVEAECDSQTECEFAPSNPFFGADPCVSTVKYLNLTYACVTEVSEPIVAPVPVTSAPAEATDVPAGAAEATDAPAEETDAPTEETDASAEGTDAPAEGTDAEGTDAPAEGTDAEGTDAEGTDAPAEGTDAEGTDAPADETDAPTEGTDAEATDAPTEETDETDTTTPVPMSTEEPASDSDTTGEPTEDVDSDGNPIPVGPIRPGTPSDPNSPAGPSSAPTVPPQNATDAEEGSTSDGPNSPNPSASSGGDQATEGSTVDGQAPASPISSADTATGDGGPDEDSTPTSTPNTQPTDPEDDEGSVCFPADATVQLVSGLTRQMQDLEINDVIQTSDRSFNAVFFFSHRSKTVVTSFVELTAAGRTLRLSPSHYLVTSRGLTAAKAVSVGDVLYHSSLGNVEVERVSRVRAEGLYAPHTMGDEGTLFVDGFRVSEYTTSVHPAIAKVLLGPIKSMHKIGMSRYFERLLSSSGHSSLAKLMPGGPAKLSN